MKVRFISLVLLVLLLAQCVDCISFDDGGKGGEGHKDKVDDEDMDVDGTGDDLPLEGNENLTLEDLKNDGALVLRIELSNDSVYRNHEMEYTVVVENVGDSEVRILPYGVEVWLTHPDGNRSWLTYCEDRGASIYCNEDLVTLRPYGTYNQTLWQVFKEPGRYRLEAEYFSGGKQPTTIPFWQGTLNATADLTVMKYHHTSHQEPDLIFEYEPHRVEKYKLSTERYRIYRSYTPSFNTEATKILFYGFQRQDVGELFIYDLKDGNITKVPAPGAHGRARFSTNGEFIAYFSRENGEQVNTSCGWFLGGNLWITNINGSWREQYTTKGYGGNLKPFFSHDDRYVYIIQEALLCAELPSDLLRVDLDTREIVNLTEDDSLQHEARPYGEDRLLILEIGPERPAWRSYDLETGARENVSYWFPSWNASFDDSGNVCFTYDYDVYLLNVTNGIIYRLTFDELYYLYPEISRDGKKITVSAFSDSNYMSADIYVIELDRG